MEDFDKLQELIRPEQIHQLREPVAMPKQASFFRYVHRLRDRVEQGKLHLDEDELIRRMDELLMMDTPSEVLLRRVFASLACTESIAALRAIELVLPELTGSKREWALLAELQLRISIVGDLLGERQVAMTSGLGGSGTLIRINGIVLSRDFAPWLPYQQELMTEELRRCCSEEGGSLEEEIWGECFYIFVVLLPYNSDIMPLIRGYVKQCNEYGQFIQMDCMVTNLQKFTAEDANKLIDELKQSQDNQQQDQTPTLDDQLTQSSDL
ncbi:hypothetical protein [Porphyromonas sp. COT-290 OH860]|uniref:hypothetical protein n=1 Tax=Porphyromonas sp. COT-290 OH860 TaxID=1515615 RepID=UPI00052DB2DD|nr:hypothetical protein [Porphyromonas sp. COT-290 OH860]KGN84480.1 hypothetical protein HQ41_04600 [Porphyromonas sp. COT-290 OH860]